MQPIDQASQSSAKNKKVLVVDDEKLVLELVSQMLSIMGHDVVTVGSGAEAINLFSETKFDLILTDFQMPDMDGCVLAAIIKKCSDCTPVILMTGYGDNKSIQKMIDESCIDCLMFKPFSFKEFKTAVNNLLYPDAT